MDYQQEVGKRLRQARKESGYTQEEVAKKMGILQPAYARYETGKIQLNYDQIKFLCDLFSCTPDYLFGYEE
ncbi:MAG: helix-turn-helix transcriptional regulator [Clostridia bacterium]|nr:helix-turn-helix transcriptional regulator [Clostridia bacterium]